LKVKSFAEKGTLLSVENSAYCLNTILKCFLLERRLGRLNL